MSPDNVPRYLLTHRACFETPAVWYPCCASAVHDVFMMWRDFEYTPPADVVGGAAEAVYVGREFDESLEHDLQHFKVHAEAEQGD